MRRHAVRLAGGILACAVLVLPSVFTASFTDAVASQVTVRPISTVSNSGWTASGTGNGDCSGECDLLDETVTDGDTTSVTGAAGQAPVMVLGLGGASSSGQTATSIEVHVVGRANSNALFGYRPTDVALTIGGTTLPTQSVTWGSTSYADSSFTFSGNWSKADVDNATVSISKTANGLQPAIRISTVYAYVNYISPVQNQNAVRLYANANSTAPGAPLAATNVVGEATASTPFRLRAGLAVGDTTWTTGSWGDHNNQYKLQYTAKNASTCAASSGWADVSASTGAIRWYNNPGVADGAGIGSIGTNDLTVSGTKIYQAYRESNPFTLSTNTSAGNTAVWDFSLQSVGTTPGAAYCLRIVQNDGTALNAYSAYPEVLMVGTYDVSIVNASGTVVTSPVVTFPNYTVKTNVCNGTAATLGTSSQRIRITNNLVKNGWNVSIAPTAGPTAAWTAGAYSYDFNDLTSFGCADGPDNDARKGVMQVDPTAATITGSCVNTGLSRGSALFFEEGVTDAITLVSATASSSRFCYWDVTGISIGQNIPAATPAGSYSLDMTVTMTAL